MTDVEVKRTLRQYLTDQGYIAYPMEMQFGGFCDVTGFLNHKFYAFEIKQKGDNIHKALEQLKDYSRGVDYCIVVVDKIGKRQSVKFKEKGYGIWKRNGSEFIEELKPEQMNPLPNWLNHTRKKLRRECYVMRSKKIAERLLDKFQMKIEDYD
jgi:hypothetical protein